MASEFQEFELYKGKVKVKFFPNSHQYWINGKRAGGSVTSIIGVFDKSNALVSWATELFRDHLLDLTAKGVKIIEEHIFEGCNLHSQKKQEAADIGSKIHDWCDKYIRGEKPEMPEEKEVQIGVNAFLDWIDANKVKFISSERAVYSLKHNFVGKMDIEAKVNGKLVLIDLKSSNGIYNTMNMQTAAYVKADEEESGKEYKGRWILRLAKESEKEYNARMEKKNFNRERNGKDSVEYPPYQVFEAKFLDEDPKNIEKDYKAFLACKTLKDWDKLTGYYSKK